MDPQTAAYPDLETHEGEYHSLSVLAIVALVIGLLSPLAFAHPLLWVLPIGGIGLALVAIFRIDRSDGALAGRTAAGVGLVLSLLCGAGAMTQAASRNLWLKHRANRLADHLVELLREGKSYEAHQLWARPQYRFAPGSDLAKLYAENPAAEKDYESFVSQQVIAELLKLGASATVERQRTRHTYGEGDLDFVVVYYHLHATTPSGELDKDIRFVAERREDEDGVERWRVYPDDRPEDSIF